MAHINEITSGAKFRHYKNKDYEVLTLATDEATEETVVVYRALYGAYDVWVRRVESFCENVTVDGSVTERFKLIV